jgi:hypothetical protein
MYRIARSTGAATPVGERYALSGGSESRTSLRHGERIRAQLISCRGIEVIALTCEVEGKGAKRSGLVGHDQADACERDGRVAHKQQLLQEEQACLRVINFSNHDAVIERLRAPRYGVECFPEVLALAQCADSASPSAMETAP